jgi:hypothetical protein
MRKTGIALVAALLGITALPLFAQSGANDTLSALLSEVRLLRMALERSAEAPQLQLLGTRLAVQNQRLQEAIRAHAGAQNELQGLLNFATERTAELQRSEEQLASNVPAPQREALEQLARQMKSELAAQSSREPQLRAREAELAAAVAAEQNQWLLMNQRLDELERALKAR